MTYTQVGLEEIERGTPGYVETTEEPPRRSWWSRVLGPASAEAAESPKDERTGFPRRISEGKTARYGGQVTLTEGQVEQLLDGWEQIFDEDPYGIHRIIKESHPGAMSAEVVPKLVAALEKRRGWYLDNLRVLREQYSDNLTQYHKVEEEIELLERSKFSQATTRLPRLKATKETLGLILWEREKPIGREEQGLWGRIKIDEEILSDYNRMLEMLTGRKDWKE